MMKRILFSLLCSTVFLVMWMFLSLVFEVSGISSPETTDKFAIPFRLPSFIYFDFLQLQMPESLLLDIIFVSSAILFNILFYGFIFYVCITLFLKIRGKSITEEIEKIEVPPDPPIF